MKVKTNILILLALLGIAIFYKSTEVMSVLIYDENNQLYSKETTSMPVFKSLFAFGDSMSIGMSGSEARSTDTADFEILIRNPRFSDATLYSVEIYINDNLYKTIEDNILIKSNTEITYLVERISLVGKEMEKNSIKINLHFRANDEEYTTTYTYDYYLLVPCLSNADCTDSICDNTLNLEYDTTGITYCAKTCSSDEHCSIGKDCIGGICK